MKRNFTCAGVKRNFTCAGVKRNFTCAGVKRMTKMLKRNFTCRKCGGNIGEAVEQDEKL